MNWFDILPSLHPGDALMAVVDGGGTGSRAAIAKSDGTVLGYSEGGSANARAIGDVGAAGNLAGVVSDAAREAGVDLDELRVCVVASAAMDTLDQSRHLSNMISSRLAGSAHVVIVPDSLGCWAVTADLGPGIAVVSGTGSVVVAADFVTGICRVYGNGDYLLGDDGSGFAIGRSALQYALLYAQGRVSDPTVPYLCLAHFGIDSFESIPDAVHKPRVDKSKIAGLARVVLDEATAGSKSACEIVASEVRRLAGTANAAIRLNPTLAETVGCFGSVFRNSFFRREFETQLGTMSGRQLNLSFLRRFVLAGAFRLALARGRPGWEDAHGDAVQQFDECVRNAIRASRDRG